MKKIAMILSTIPQMGGEYQYESILAEILVANAGKSYELIVVCRNSYWRNWCKSKKIPYVCYRYFEDENAICITNLKHPYLSGIYHRFFTDLGRVFRKEKIKLIVSGRQGVFVPNYFIKEIRPVHDLMHRYEGRFEEIGSGYQSREILFQNVAKNAATIFVDSELGKKQFEECYVKNGISGLDIVVLPYIIPENILNKSEEIIEVPERYVFYPAQFWEHKNHINLLKAITLVREQVPDICLVLVGSEKNVQKKVWEYIKENDLEDNVIIKGFVSDENIKYLYKHAIGLVMPTYFGPTNIPPLEAMALGCPVAVSNKYAMPEQVGDAGLLFSPDDPQEIADCICKMWNDEELRKRMIQHGYRRVQDWTRKDFEQKLISTIVKYL